MYSCSGQIMQERISVEKNKLREVYDDLKNQGYSISQISERIDSDFRNHLYKSTSFTRGSFRKLQCLYDGSIPSTRVKYIDGRGQIEELELERDEFLAEFAGMILGDGHIDKHSYNRGDRYISSHYLCITLASVEKRIIERAKFLAKKCLDRNFSEEKLNHANALNLKLYGKDLVQALEQAGLSSGDKVENQVGVPEWVKADTEFSRTCLRGLIDTDGSIYKRKEGEKVVYFKNRSKPLLDDFCDMCSDLNINTSKAGNHARQVAAQRDVQKFIDKIDPIKASDM
ncbi:MAG: hypothetical protein ACI8Z7_000497 [Candidatus Nanohaloarchaea archaeon]|jgi:hypothetical protein